MEQQLENAHTASELRLPADLRPYQWEGVSFLYRSASALLADEMGLGKTVQAAVALSLALKDSGIDRALVVAPSSLTLNWERELARWAPLLSVRRLTGGEQERAALYQLPVNILIASYDQIRIDAFDQIPTDTFDLVVLDEAQRIKNWDSRTAFACRLLPRERSWALTATPLENSRADLESVFAFIRPGLVNRSMSKATLFDQIAPHLLRRRKTDVLPDLPPVIIQDLELELTPEQRCAYDDLWVDRMNSVQAEADPVSNTCLFALLSQLKQVCNRDRDTGASSKLEALQDVVDALSASTDKLIVFSQYVDTLNWLALRLGDVKIDLYHGSLSQSERDEVVSQFETQNGPRVLLMSLRAGGVGLNLQAASTVVLFDRWWNPAAEVQAIYRAHRFDRSRPLHVFRYLVRDTVEERIDRILQAKQGLFEEYVEQAPSAEAGALTRKELMSILDLYPSGTH